MRMITNETIKWKGLAVLLVMIPTLVFSQLDVKEYTLQSFLLAVENNNIKLQVSHNEKQLSQLAIKEAMSAMLPQINGQTGFKRYFNDQYTYFEAPDYENIDPVTGTIPQGMQKFKMGFDNDFQAHLLLQQSLISLKHIYELQAAREFSVIGELKNKQQLINILAEAEKTFLQAVLMKKVCELSRASERFAQDNYLSAQSKYQNKLISKLDELQARILWEEEIPKTLRAQRNYLILLENLKAIAGIQPDDSITIYYRYHDEKVTARDTNAEGIVTNRYDYQLLEANCALQRKVLKSKRAEYFPTLELSGGHSYFSNSDKWSVKENSNKFTYAKVTLTVPIFSSGYRKAQLSKAKIMTKNAELKTQDAHLNMLIEIKNLRYKLSEEYRAIETAQTVLETSRKVYDIAVENANSGLTSQLDLRKMSTDYKRAKINYFHSIYNYKCTEVDYNNAIANY